MVVIVHSGHLVLHWELQVRVLTELGLMFGQLLDGVVA